MDPSLIDVAKLRPSFDIVGWMGKGGALAAMLVVVGVTACGTARHVVSSGPPPTPSKVYLACESAATQARDALGYANGSFAPGNVDRLIASFSKRAATALGHGERELNSLPAAGNDLGDARRHAAVLPVLEQRLRLLSRQADANHQAKPLAVLHDFGVIRGELASTCPRSA